MADPHSTPTPETDAVLVDQLPFETPHVAYEQLAQHTKRMERERDAARAALAEARDSLICRWFGTNAECRDPANCTRPECQGWIGK